MTFFAHRLSRINLSPTLAMAAKAGKMRATGIDVINLSTGEIDFDTPQHIKDAAVRAMDQGLTKYTPTDGYPSLKKAIQNKLQRDNGLSYALNEIMVSVGGKQAIFNAFMATIESGDEVIVPAPYWVSYPDIVRLFGGTPVIVAGNEQFKLTPAALEAHITPRTKWLILNSPSNPTGQVYTRTELEALAQVLSAHPHVHVMSDDIYEYLVYDAHQFHNLLMVSPELKDRFLLINGISKSYSMTGWRIGYAAGPASLIQAMATLQSQSTSNPCSIAQAAALAALESPMDFMGAWRESFVQRRDIAVRAIGAIPGLSCIQPHGAFYVYVSCAGIIGKRTPAGHTLATDEEVVAYLLESVHVAVVPGSAFGLSPFFRLSYVVAEELLIEACMRIHKAISALEG